MSKETTETKAEKQTKVMQPVELNDDKLDAVVGGRRSVTDPLAVVCDEDEPGFE